MRLIAPKGKETCHWAIVSIQMATKYSTQFKTIFREEATDPQYVKS